MKETTTRAIIKTGNYAVAHVPGLFEPIELTCFIVPNQGRKIRQFIGSMGSILIKRLKVWGIEADAEDTVLQVWIAPKDPELLADDDNWSDHGVPLEVAAVLTEKDDEGRVKHLHAPSFLPLNILETAKEGERKEFLSGNGKVRVGITFEQLPYHYRQFGKFEDVVRSTAIRTLENIKFQDEIRNINEGE